MADPFAEYMVNIQRLIAEYGWAVQGVFPTEDSTERRSWCYTIGLWRRFWHPELCIFGVSTDTGTRILNDMGKRIRGGEDFAPGKRYTEVIEGNDGQDFTVGIVDVPKVLHKDFFNAANRYYRLPNGGLGRFKVRQVLWPDAENRLPSEPGFSPSLREHQPVLNEDFTRRN